MLSASGLAKVLEGTTVGSQLSDPSEGVLLVYHEGFFLLLTFLHVVEHVHYFFRFLGGGSDVRQTVQVLQLLGAHLPKQLVLLLPGDDHARVNVGGRLLDGARRRLRRLHHLVEIRKNLGVECVLHVLGLVEVVLLLLLAVAQELQVLLGVHGAQLVLLAVLQVLNVLLVEDLVAHVHLVLVALLLTLHLVLEVLSVLSLLLVRRVKPRVVMRHKFACLLV